MHAGSWKSLPFYTSINPTSLECAFALLQLRRLALSITESQLKTRHLKSIGWFIMMKMSWVMGVFIPLLEKWPRRIRWKWCGRDYPGYGLLSGNRKIGFRRYSFPLNQGSKFVIISPKGLKLAVLFLIRALPLALLLFLHLSIYLAQWYWN